MTHYTRIAVLCCLLFAGCSTAHFKDATGERLSLSGYDHICVRPVEAASDIDHPGLPVDLAARIQQRLNQSKFWIPVTDTPAQAGATEDHRIDLAVTVVKAKYPSRSKIIWLGAAHKMTCRLEVFDHATSDLLGSTQVSSSVEPLMGNAATLNFGWVGILGRTAFDTRRRDTASLHDHIAKEVVQALDRAKEEPP